MLFHSQFSKIAQLRSKVIPLDTFIERKISSGRDFTSGESLNRVVHDSVEKTAHLEVNILNEEDDKIYFKSYGIHGFTLSNDTFLIGPCIALQKSVMYWHVKDSLDIHEKSLSIFNILLPKLDILIIGKGMREDQINYERIAAFRKKSGIACEILPTDQAVATFNFLNNEGRYVGAAVIPQKSVGTLDEELELVSKRQSFRDILKTERITIGQSCSLDELLTVKKRPSVKVANLDFEESMSYGERPPASRGSGMTKNS